MTKKFEKIGGKKFEKLILTQIGLKQIISQF